MKTTQSPSEKEIKKLIIYIEQGLIDEAAANAKLMTHNYPNYQFGWKALGVTLQFKGEYRNALEAHLKAIKLDEKDYEAFSNLGACQSEIGLLIDAEISHKKSIKLNPKYAQAYSNLGVVQQKLGKLEEARENHEVAISLNPEIINFKYNLSLVYIELDKLEEAETCLRNIIKIQPNFSKAYSYLALVLKKLGNIHEALQFSIQSLHLDENSYEANYIKASLLFDLGKLDDALIHLIKANSIRSDVHTEVAIKNIKDEIKNHGKSINLDSIEDDRFFIFEREVEPELISCLYELDSNSFKKTADARYGNGRCSKGFNFLNEPYPIVAKLKEDFHRILSKLLNKNIYIVDSFFNIINTESGTKPHHHLKLIDCDFNLSHVKYSLVYYLSVGDQTAENPGILNLFDPECNILPKNGMLIVIPSARKHSAIYSGREDRVLIGVNFYCTN